jgi:steroid delta-isomerase-like uncharacterized protein
MSADNMKAVFYELREAFLKGDWKTYRQLLTDDAVYEEEATGRRVVGAGEIIKTVEPWRRAFPDLDEKVNDMVATRDALVVEVEWSGTNSGPLAGPFGTISPTGRFGRLPAVLLYRFEGDRIREIRHYFDLLTLLAQAGVPTGLSVGR